MTVPSLRGLPRGRFVSPPPPAEKEMGIRTNTFILVSMAFGMYRYGVTHLRSLLQRAWLPEQRGRAPPPSPLRLCPSAGETGGLRTELQDFRTGAIFPGSTDGAAYVLTSAQRHVDLVFFIFFGRPRLPQPRMPRTVHSHLSRPRVGFPRCPLPQANLCDKGGGGGGGVGGGSKSLTQLTMPMHNSRERGRRGGRR